MFTEYKIGKVSILVEKFFKTRGGKPYFDVDFRLNNKRTLSTVTITAKDEDDALKKALKMLETTFNATRENEEV